MHGTFTTNTTESAAQLDKKFTRTKWLWVRQMVNLASLKKVPHAATSIAVVLADYCNRAQFHKTGMCEAYPPQELIAKKIGLDVRTVRSVMAKMVSAGGLAITEASHWKKGKRLANNYRLVLELEDASTLQPESWRASDAKSWRASAPSQPSDTEPYDQTRGEIESYNYHGSVCLERDDTHEVSGSDRSGQRDGVVVPSRKANSNAGTGKRSRVNTGKSSLPTGDPGDVIAHRWRIEAARWRPSPDEMRKVPPHLVEIEIEKFRGSHFNISKQRTVAEWSACWQLWCDEWQRRNPGQVGLKFDERGAQVGIGLSAAMV